MLRPLAVLTVGLILAVPQVGALPAVGGDGVLGDIRFSFDADTNLVSASAGTLASAVTDGAASAGRHRSLVAPPANSIGDVYDAGRSLLAPRPGGQRIALGLGDDLDDFAGAQGAITYRDFPGGTGRFADDFVDFAGNPNNEVLFNLDGVRSPWSSVQRAGDLTLDEAMRAGASITDWELGQIYRNNWTHVQFFEGGVPVPSPFGG